MGTHKKCIFVQGRPCPFPADQIPLQTCQICIEAWKTDLSSRNAPSTNTQTSTPHSTYNSESQPISLNHLSRSQEAAFTQTRLKEIDDMFKNGELEPFEYIEMRKAHVNQILQEPLQEPKQRLNLTEIENEETIPTAREIKGAVVVKSLFGKKIYPFPSDYKIPKSIKDKAINSIFKLMKTKLGDDIRIGIGDHKIACIKHAKTKFVFIVLDGDESFNSYEYEINKLKELLEGEKLWVRTLKNEFH